MLHCYYQPNIGLVDLKDSASQSHCIQWWEELTAGGGEGMVVKPLEFISHNGKGLLQPAVKCRETRILADHLWS